MHFILAILIYPILLVTFGNVTSKFKCNFGIEEKIYSPKRLNCIGISVIYHVNFVFSSFLYKIKN